MNFTLYYSHILLLKDDTKTTESGRENQKHRIIFNEHESVIYLMSDPGQARSPLGVSISPCVI